MTAAIFGKMDLRMIFARVFWLAGLQVVLGAGSTEEEKMMLRRQTTHDLFKGDPIPEVNWTSPDIYNFTWGLTGVDNHENFAFA